MENKETKPKSKDENGEKKPRTLLTTEERILFSVVLVLIGCIILINTSKTVDFNPTVRFTGGDIDSAAFVSAVSAASVEPTTQSTETKAITKATIDSKAKPASSTPEPVNPQTANKNSIINLNSATLEELMTLDGIGEVKAMAIINYRTQNGRFKCIEDLLSVKGIGEKTFENIRGRITVD